MKRRGKKMKKFIKYGSIVVISLAILISCNVNSYDCDVFAEEKNEEQNTETDIICNWPEDIIDPGPALPQYLSAPKIMNILNTNKGIKVQWKKVNNAHGYRIQRKLGNSKWKDLKILKENQYTDKTVENGKKYQYKIYAYASNSIDFIESTGTKSITKKILYLKAPVISNIKKSQNTRYKIVWKKNKKADGRTNRFVRKYDNCVSVAGSGGSSNRCRSVYLRCCGGRCRNGGMYDTYF